MHNVITGHAQPFILRFPVTLAPKQFLRHLFDTAVAATDPRRVLTPFLPPVPQGRLIVVGAGKGSGAMALAADQHYGATAEGLVVTRDGYRLPTAHITVVEAAHPVPDARSVAAAQRILELVKTAGPDDVVLCLLSGGASALMCLPVPAISFDEKQALNAALLKSGAAIDEINCVRKHLSLIKGGRLAQACGQARVVSLIISDVVGDDLSVIGSGPTVADPSTSAQALAVLRKYNIPASDDVTAYLQQPQSETPKHLSKTVMNKIVIRPRDAFTAAQAAVETAGFACLDLGDRHEGDVAALAQQHADLARSIAAGQHALKPPCVILSGGEATVRVSGAGVGGPNTQFALEFAEALKGHAGIYGIFCDSDGTDGNGDHAGAIATPDTLADAARLDLNPAQAVQNSDTATFFKALGDLVVSGPTFTNVNDFRAILILPAQ
jgi:hydroxypyruvate reductase